MYRCEKWMRFVESWRRRIPSYSAWYLASLAKTEKLGLSLCFTGWYLFVLGFTILFRSRRSKLFWRTLRRPELISNLLTGLLLTDRPFLSGLELLCLRLQSLFALGFVGKDRGALVVLVVFGIPSALFTRGGMIGKDNKWNRKGIRHQMDQCSFFRLFSPGFCSAGRLE